MNNKRILLTGATGDIGTKIAYLLAKEGYDLSLVGYKSFDTLSAMKNTLETEYHISVDIYKCDLADKSEIKRMTDDCLKKGDLYGIINNAAISYIGLLTDMSDETVDEVIDTNLNSAIILTKNLLPLLIHNHEGRIINTSSIWGNVGASTEVVYSATKGGINAFTKALAKELAPSNIPVNAIAFGMIDTKMNAHLSEDEIMEIRSEIPMDRIASAEEAAQMVLSVLNAPSYMTGQIITMDGGWT